MSEDYVVDVSAPAPGETGVVTERLAQVLKVDEARIRTLIRRLPDVVTRPISFDEASVVVERFNSAGLRARVRKVSRDSAPTLFEEPAAKPTFEQAGEPALPDDDFAEDDDLFLETDPIVTGESALPAEPADSAAEAAVPVSEPETLRPTSPPDAAAAEAAVKSEPEPAVSSTEAADTRPPASPRPDRQSRVFETFEELTPAELQARLRREGGTTTEAAAVAPPSSEAAAAAPEAAARPARRGSLRSKLLSTAIIPVLLAIIGALAATWYTARPALYQQLLDSARNPAIATAASLSSAFEQTASTTGIDYLQLQSTILITRQAFPREDISFIIATDNQGNPLPGFIVGAESLTADAADLQNAIRDRAVEAIELGVDARTGRVGASSQLAGAATGIEIVAQPLIVNDEPVGAVVVGVSDAGVTAQVNRIIVNVLLFSLIPLLLAIFIAVRRARRLTDNVLALTERADGISRGELEEQVEFHSNDELDDLAAALERMRVSMRGALERLRRRR